MNTILSILTLLLMVLGTYDEITENISEITASLPFPIMPLLKIIGIVLLLYWIAYFLLRIFNKRKISSNDYDIIFDIFNKIITEIETSLRSAGDIVIKHYGETDEIKRFIINKLNKKDQTKFDKIYENYKKPRNETVWPEIWVYPYNLDSKKFAKHPEYHINGVNNGKEFAKYNIQKILNFLK